MKLFELFLLFLLAATRSEGVSGTQSSSSVGTLRSSSTHHGRHVVPVGLWSRVAFVEATRATREVRSLLLLAAAVFGTMMAAVSC